MPLFVFAYGSLIFRPSKYFGERRSAVVHGVRRAFRQASPDHRGTPSFPGRVVTLLREEGARCGGAVFTVADADVEAALIELDDRESGGYDRAEVHAHVKGEADPIRAVTWIAAPHNANHLPHAPIEEIASVVRRAHGKSGPNIEYVRRLAAALREMDVHDPEVIALEAALASDHSSRSVG
ncbi:MAG: gamma-glutamylcyclotransferase [Polyangiaceae bacterium]